MPPKKQGQVPNKKTVEKKKEKVIEDKTFGIKNKKGKKQQTFIKQVTNQVKYGGGQGAGKREGDVYQQKKDKAQMEKEQAELQGLFKPVPQSQKISAGADPKSVLCLFFKQGACTKGDKCKFSHDMSLENKAEKRSMYVDARDSQDLKEDTIDKWDTDKLNEVVEKKHSSKIKTKTDIVCRHFLQAIEKGIYGWFWECPSGDKCIYRHALPPGFVLKKMQKEQEELQPQDSITLDELVENERDALISSGMALTKVTLESFLAWKKRKLKEKTVKAENAMAKRKEAFHQGRTLGISGREMFLFNPEMVGEDDEDEEEGGTVFHMVRQESDEDEEEGVDMATVLAAIGDGDEVTLVKSKGEPSSSAKLQVSDSEDEDRGGALNGAVGGTTSDSSDDVGDADVVVDEQLFEDGFDDIAGQTALEEVGVGTSSNMDDAQQEHVDVDESLFDVDDLGTLNLDDPNGLVLPSDDTAS